jgi:hypothetical protein
VSASARKRVAREIAALDRDPWLVCGGAGERGGSAHVALDGVDRTITGQGKGERAEPGEEIDRRARGTDSGKNLLDEDHLGRWAGLQKSPGRERNGNPGQEHPNRPALDDDKLVEARTPDDAGEVTFFGEPPEGIACAELRPLRRLDHQVDPTVGVSEGRLRRRIRHQKLERDLPEPLGEREEYRFEHRAFAQVHEVVAEPFTVPDPRRGTRIARPADPEPHPPPFRRNESHRRDDTWIDPHPFEGGLQFLRLDPPVCES